MSGTYHYLKDGLGSVTGVTTDTGSLVQRYVYSSFGKLLKTVDASGLEGSPLLKTSYTYTNREFDEETGLYYYRARYYDSHSGRFMQEDPHPGSTDNPMSFLSKYTYVENDPFNATDPSGLITLRGVVSLAAAFTVGFAAGLVFGMILGPVMGAVTGGAVGYQLGGEVAYFTNRMLGGSRDEANSYRNKGRTWGMIGGIIGGVVGGILGNKSVAGSDGRSPAWDGFNYKNLSEITAKCILSVGATVVGAGMLGAAAATFKAHPGGSLLLAVGEVLIGGVGLIAANTACATL